MAFIQDTLGINKESAAAVINPVLVLGSGVGPKLQQYKQQKKALRAQQGLADLQNRRQRVQAVREARIKRAQVISEGTAVGGAGSSALASGAGGIRSQLAGNLSFLEQAGIFQQQSMKAQEKAAKWGAIDSLTSQFLSTALTFGLGGGGGGTTPSA